ncbi:hypothetical protein HMPREF3291_01130 [Bacillus sp. HMSC76G11]|nr:hypothetical protein HMPREF3291_01130 [Bacillus sp. HMSC76G11]
MKETRKKNEDVENMIHNFCSNHSINKDCCQKCPMDRKLAENMINRNEKFVIKGMVNTLLR